MENQNNNSQKKLKTFDSKKKSESHRSFISEIKTAQPMSAKQQLILGLIPILIFTVVENYGGLFWALIISVVYAVFEISWEFLKNKKVTSFTLFSNLMVIGLSSVSYFTESGVWFKLQPALLEFAFAGILIGSGLIKKPFLIETIKVQNPEALNNELFLSFMRALNYRLGFFFVFQSAIAVYSAYYWSTAAWGFLKGIGVFIMLFVYMVIELILFRKSAQKSKK